MKVALPLLFLLLFSVVSQMAAQTVTFTTNGGSLYPEHYNVVSEDGSSASGTVEIAGAYGYTQSGIVLPYNPTAPGEYLNPVINILSATYTGNWGDQTRTFTYTFNSTESLYGYYWSGTFSSQIVCVREYRGKCAAYVPGSGSGTMTAIAAP
jgi:hypothetical protein